MVRELTRALEPIRSEPEMAWGSLLAFQLAYSPVRTRGQSFG